VDSNVKIELSRNNGADWDILFDNLVNDGLEIWNVTGDPTSEALIRISSVDDPDVFDASDSPFVIK
jgi:hypothetical protein